MTGCVPAADGVATADGARHHPLARGVRTLLVRTGLQRRGAARRPALLLAAALTLSLSLIACTSAGQPDDGGGLRTGDPVVGAAASQTPAAELQAGLTHLLVERVYVIAAAGRAGLSEPARMDAGEVLDANSQALAEVLGATYPGARSPLLGALRSGDKAQLVHAAALASGDAAAVARARTALEQAAKDLPAVLQRLVPSMPMERVAVRLREDLEAQLTPQSDQPYTALRTAAGRAVDTASLLAAAVTADRSLGTTSTRAATLRAELTALLTEHVLLVGALAQELAALPGAAPGAGGRGAAAAQAALDANARALSMTLGGAYPAAAGPFLATWTDYLGRLETYAAGVAAAGAAPSGELRAAPQTFGQLLAQHIDGLSPGRIATDLTPWLNSLLRAVDAAATRSPRASSALHRAVADAPPPAAVLAAATAEHLRLR